MNAARRYPTPNDPYVNDKGPWGVKVGEMFVKWAMWGSLFAKLEMKKVVLVSKPKPLNNHDQAIYIARAIGGKVIRLTNYLEVDS